MSQCVNIVLDGAYQEDVDQHIAKMEKESPLHTPLCFSKLNFELHFNLDPVDGIESYSWTFFSVFPRDRREMENEVSEHIAKRYKSRLNLMLDYIAFLQQVVNSCFE